MNRWILFSLCAGLLSALAPARAETARVPIADLGDLTLEYASVQALEEVPGPPVQARVTHRGGAMYSIALPRDARRAIYLVDNGHRVTAGQPFVTLEGPEIHHLLLEFESLETRYSAAKERYERSREPYRQQALQEEKWVAILDRYLELQLEYEHMLHFLELVQEVADDTSRITLIAPIDGRIQYHDSGQSLKAGTDIASFLAADALQVRARVPVVDSPDLVALGLPDCRLAVAAVDQVAVGFFLTAWSEPVPGECGLPLNATVSASPLYRQSAYSVPRAAVFNLNGEEQVLVRRDNVLEAVAVSLMMPVAGGYAVSTGGDLTDVSVLVTSVSAVQGILLGLGGE